MIKTLTHKGNEYTIVRDWREDEKLGYRELGNEQIEVMSMFCGNVQLFKVHIAALKIVLDFRKRMISGEDQRPNEPTATRTFQ